MISHDKSGGRTIHLYIPFEFNGKKIESIVLGPLRFGHVLRWNEGVWKSMLELLVDMAGVDETVIRELRYPDADRVLEAFFSLLTPEIRSDIQEGRIPTKMDMPQEEPPAPQPQQGPGAPLPDAPIDENPGFDMGEVP
jgi:hypothetical protein